MKIIFSLYSSSIIKIDLGYNERDRIFPQNLYKLFLVLISLQLFWVNIEGSMEKEISFSNVLNESNLYKQKNADFNYWKIWFISRRINCPVKIPLHFISPISVWDILFSPFFYLIFQKDVIRMVLQTSFTATSSSIFIWSTGKYYVTL